VFKLTLNSLIHSPYF